MVFSLIALALTAFLVISLSLNLFNGLRVYILLFLLSQPFMRVDPGNISVQSALLQLTALYLLGNFLINTKNFRAQIRSFPHSNAVLWLCIPLFFTIFLSDIGGNLVGYFNFLLRRVIYLYIGWLAVDSLRNGTKLIKYIMVLFLVLCAYGMIELWMGKNVFLDSFREMITERKIMSYSAEGRGYRVQSFYYHPYPWGGVLIILSSIFLYLTLNETTSKYRRYYLAGLGLIFLNIFFTRSRSAIIPESMLITFALLINSGKSSQRVKIMFSMASLVFLILILNPALIDKIAPYFSASNENGGLRGSTSDMRLLQFSTTFDAIKNNLAGGLGFGAATKIISGVGGDTELQAFESIWLSVIYNHGLVGLLGYCMFFITLLLNFIKLKRTLPEFRRAINLICLAIICYTLFISLTGEMLTFPFFFLFIGIVSKQLYLYKNLIWRRKIESELRERQLTKSAISI